MDQSAVTQKIGHSPFDFFVASYGVKYDKAVGKLTKDRDVLLAFYDFPAEHWKHIRTTNPIESTVRRRMIWNSRADLVADGLGSSGLCYAA